MNHEMNLPLVSIVIPIYNGSNFMREAIDSALAQTYPKIEILVVNDGSTDNTREIALSYGDKIRYFEKENGGVATALNLGIQEMRGEYFSWLSHDDWYAPDKVEEEIAAIQSYEDGDMAAYSDLEMVPYPHGIRHRMRARRFGKKLAETGWFANSWWFVNGCTLMIPKSYFSLYGGFDESKRAVNDIEQFFRMFKHRQLIHVDRVLVYSRVHERQVTWNYEGMQKENVWLITWLVKQLIKSDIDMADSGITRYQYLSMKLSQIYGISELQEAQNILVDFLKREKEPVLSEKERKKLDGKLHEFASGCYVYCAGRAARRFLRSLRWRGIVLTGLSDSSSSKWGCIIEKIRCIPPSEIPKDANIIVANASPDEIVNQLRFQGFLHVASYEDWEYGLLLAPIKRECCEVLQ